MINNRVFEGEYRVEGDKRILQCHSRGDKRYSPFFCFVKALVQQIASRTTTNAPSVLKVAPNPVTGWTAARYWKRQGCKQIAWQIGDRELPVKSNEQGTSFAIDDWGIQYYIALWHRHLSQHPEKVEWARQFDEFEDPFKRNFPFGQADVIRVAAREGVEALLPYFAPLKQLFDTK